MSVSQRRALSKYRKHLKHRGIVRLEVRVNKNDAPLIRSVVQALADPAREGHARSFLKARFAKTPGKSLKALLAALPLEGIDLARERDFGRDAEL